MSNDLFQLARSDHRYACEAYEFVCEAVTYTQERLGLLEELDADDDSPPPHVNGNELLRGGCELAVRDFGLMAPHVFSRWGILTTDDFGEIVARLVGVNRLSRSDDDDPAEFHEAFDLMQALAEGFDFDTTAYPARKVDA